MAEDKTKAEEKSENSGAYCEKEGCAAGGECCREEGGSACDGECGSCGEPQAGCGKGWQDTACRWHNTWWCVLGAVLGIFLVVWSVAKGVEIKRMLAYPPAGTPEHSITLSASGEAQVAPDTAEIEL